MTVIFFVFLLLSEVRRKQKCQNNAAALPVTNFMFSHEMPCSHVWWFQFFSCLFWPRAYC